MKIITRLSKSQFLRGVQCPKALWLFRQRPELMAEVTESKQHLFDTGHEVGVLAQQYFENGIEIAEEYYEIDKAIASTEAAVSAGHPAVFEASACSPDGAYSRIDILSRVSGSNRWDMIEVKATTTVKEVHIADMALQRYAFSGAGHDIRRSILMHVNSEYVRRGLLDVKKLFHLEDCTDFVEDRMKPVAGELRELLQMVNTAEEPEIAIGAHCTFPYECDFIGYCWKHVPEYSVYKLFSGEKLATLLSEGILDVADVPAGFGATPRRQVEIDAYRRNRLHVDRAAIENFLDRLVYPLFYLDYETVNPAVPLFDGTRPYQAVPFQFSLHIQDRQGGSVEHVEFLHTGQGDPRPNFVKALVDACGGSGSVVVYNQSFESRINNELARAFPDHAQALERINARMADLLVPFRSRALYHPKMQGSASLKSVLPALVPDLSYAGLEIGDGQTASLAYLNVLKGKLTGSEKQTVLEELRKYCSLDTLAEVRLMDVLYASLK